MIVTPQLPNPKVWKWLKSIFKKFCPNSIKLQRGYKQTSKYISEIIWNLVKKFRTTEAKMLSIWIRNSKRNLRF